MLQNAVDLQILIFEFPRSRTYMRVSLQICRILRFSPFLSTKVWYYMLQNAVDLQTFYFSITICSKVWYNASQYAVALQIFQGHIQCHQMLISIFSVDLQIFVDQQILQILQIFVELQNFVDFFQIFQIFCRFCKILREMLSFCLKAWYYML